MFIYVWMILKIQSRRNTINEQSIINLVRKLIYDVQVSDDHRKTNLQQNQIAPSAPPKSHLVFEEPNKLRQRTNTKKADKF